MTGRLLGIARKARPRGVVETIDQAAVGLTTGIAGDFRGAIKPGGRGKRQVTVMMLSDWRAAMADLGDPPAVWSDRRVNLLVDGIDLPREKGTRLRVGSALFEITGECDPCSRMEEVAPGLKAALTPGWRGGRLLRVIAAGDLAIGDAVALEQQVFGEAI
ncbi:MOSC domain-containing protein [uncultured Sphingomonas sp.]|uniref:MOSC domain-containing protein n=1 Tax=uncultured Sphingomonas sp. TaxID=158754 RepID=UPI0026136533|nr:MOSC domain-containing protein [uncultured Sphingomonas sp.]